MLVLCLFVMSMVLVAGWAFNAHMWRRAATSWMKVAHDAEVSLRRSNELLVEVAEQRDRAIRYAQQALGIDPALPQPETPQDQEEKR